MTEEPEFLRLEEVLAFHEQQMALWGGDPGVRDSNALGAALGMPSQGFGEEYFHPTLFLMAAAYAFHIAQGQPFLDGNKRTGLNCAVSFLGLNGIFIHDPASLLAAAVLGFSDGSVDKAAFATLLEGLAVAPP